MLHTFFNTPGGRHNDGDTLEAWLIHQSDWLPTGLTQTARITTKQFARLRLIGINTPAHFGDTKAAGQAATAFVRAWVKDHPSVTVEWNKQDSFGRLLATVTTPDGRVLNQDLLDTGHAEVFQTPLPPDTSDSPIQPLPELYQ